MDLIASGLNLSSQITSIQIELNSQEHTAGYSIRILAGRFHSYRMESFLGSSAFVINESLFHFQSLFVLRRLLSHNGPATLLWVGIADRG